MESVEISVPRTARYFALGDPSAERGELWFVLHGYAQLADDFLEEFEPLARPGRVFVAPEGLSRFYTRGTSGRVGASWMTRVGREGEIADTLRLLDAVYGQVFGSLDPDRWRTGVLGFSQGTAAACRWAALGHARLDRLVLWAGGVPPDLELGRLADVDATVVVGDRDPYIDEGRIQAEIDRLTAARLPHRLVRFEGAHELDADVLARVLG